MKAKRLWFSVPLIVLVIVVASVLQPSQAAPALPEVLVAPEKSIEGFQRALPGRVLVFPADQGPHPEFQTEWWYYTGNVQTDSGRHFGFELTFFRRSLLPADQVASRNSNWAANQVYMAHFAVTDVAGQKFSAFERLSRGAAGLAGAGITPAFQVWLEDWSVIQTNPGEYQLSARQDTIAINFLLKDQKGPILQGVNGYSRKGSEVGNSSYYYSLTRLETSGTILIDGSSFSVTGLTWMDHEFSTSALGAGLVGWDWYSLQLSDGSELMLFALRRADGSLDGFSSGTVIRPDGSTKTFTQQDFNISINSTWKSPHSGAVYPSGWTVDIPGEAIHLVLNPYLADQELNLSFTYWEGAVSIEGTSNGQAVKGSGYVELTGYAHSMQGQF